MRRMGLTYKQEALLEDEEREYDDYLEATNTTHPDDPAGGSQG